MESQATRRPGDYDVTEEIRQATLLTITEAARYLNVSRNYFLERMRDPTHYFRKLAPFVKDISGGEGNKPIWRIAWGDLCRFKAACPSLAEAS